MRVERYTSGYLYKTEKIIHTKKLKMYIFFFSWNHNKKKTTCARTNKIYTNNKYESDFRYVWATLLSLFTSTSTPGYCFSSQKGPSRESRVGRATLKEPVTQNRREKNREIEKLLSAIVIFSKKREKIRSWTREWSLFCQDFALE